MHPTFLKILQFLVQIFATLIYRKQKLNHTERDDKFMPQSGIVKYHVKLSMEVDGLVERADIIGAIFGQTEGLLGPEMNLNELQRVSKVGRIEVNTKSTSNTTSGDALIPMSTDIDTCALIAAAIESIDKVGHLIVNSI